MVSNKASFWDLKVSESGSPLSIYGPDQRTFGAYGHGSKVITAYGRQAQNRCDNWALGKGTRAIGIWHMSMHMEVYFDTPSWARSAEPTFAP